MSGPESLLPPLVAIVLAVLSRRIILPLTAGVFVGALLLAGKQADNYWQGPAYFVSAMWNSATATSHLQALLFSLLLGAMVGVLEAGGGMYDLVRRISRRIRSRRGGQLMIAGSGLAIFFDDYANTLLVGGTMRTSADRFKISREKLAYLVDSTAAPMAGLSVVSTWAAIEIGYMADGLAMGGIDDPTAALKMFLQSIPYRFYPCLALWMVFVVAYTGRDFGPMLTAEQESQKSDVDSELQSSEEVDSEKPSEETSNHSSLLWLAAVLPVLTCLLVVLLVLIKTGLNGVAQAEQATAFGQDASRGLLQWSSEVLGSGDSYLALIFGSAFGLGSAIILHRLLGKTSPDVLLKSVISGAMQMVPALLILWFAWALSAMTEPDQLDTGGYLARTLSDRLDPRLLPTVVFLIAGAMAFSTGTSWGTMGILTPLSIGLALQIDPTSGAEGAIVLSTCGSVLAGAILGDHCSPISDTTVLSSRASDCDHIAHVRTQMPYAISVGFICVVCGTLPAAMGVSPWIGLLAGAVLIVLMVRVLGKPAEKNAATAD